MLGRVGTRQENPASRSRSDAVKTTALTENSRHFLNNGPIYAFGEAVMARLPFEVGYTITRIVAEIAYRFSPQHLKTMEANVDHVLRATRPELAEPERERLVR